MLPIYFILIAAVISTSCISLALYLKFYNIKINNRLQNNLRDEKPLPDIRKVTLITFLCAFFVFTSLVLLITITAKSDSEESEIIPDSPLNLYISADPQDNYSLDSDKFSKGRDGGITFYTSTSTVDTLNNINENSPAYNNQPSLILKMELPEDIDDKADGIGISYSYIIENEVAANDQFSYSLSVDNILLSAFTNKPGQFIGNLYYFKEAADGSQSIIYEETIAVDIK